MILSPELIKSLKDNTDFEQFLDYILENIRELNNVYDLDKMTNEQAGEAAKVRLSAINVLKGILAPVLDFNEKKEPSTQEIQNKKDKFGL